MHRLLRPAALGAAALLTATLIGGCTKDDGSADDFCAEVKQVPALESVLARFSEADADVLADKIAKARTAYDELAEAAPEEIADATDQVVGLVDAILDAVEDNPTDPAKAAAQLRKAMADHKGVDADRKKVAAYAEDTCGVQLDATLTDGGPTASTTSTTAASTEITSTTAGGSSTTDPSGSSGG